MNDTQLAAAPGLIHIPTVAGTIVLAYNVQGVSSTGGPKSSWVLGYQCLPLISPGKRLRHRPVVDTQ